MMLNEICSAWCFSKQIRYILNVLAGLGQIRKGKIFYHDQP